jgi:hypothetical protein
VHLAIATSPIRINGADLLASCVSYAFAARYGTKSSSIKSLARQSISPFVFFKGILSAGRTADFSGHVGGGAAIGPFEWLTRTARGGLCPRSHSLVYPCGATFRPHALFADVLSGVQGRAIAHP